MALKFTDIKGNDLFVFNEHEYPESLPWNHEVKLNKIRYPDGHYTNQIIGIYLGEIEWSGTFYGTYKDGLDLTSAKERSDQLMDLLGKVVRVQYAVGGFSGDSSTVVIENLERTYKNYWEVDYKIKLSPHEPQTRVKPSKIANVSVTSALGNALSHVATGQGKAAALTTHTTAAKALAPKLAPTQPAGSAWSQLSKQAAFLRNKIQGKGK